MTWVKIGFTNCVLEKLCSSENTILTVFSAKLNPPFFLFFVVFFSVLLLSLLSFLCF